MSDIDTNALQEQLCSRLDYCPETGVFKWRDGKRAGARAGSPNGRGYRHIYLARRLWAEHRLAWLYVHGRWPDGVLDHINGRVADNRIANLRDVTVKVNLQNIGTDGDVGVRRQGSKWRALIGVDGRLKHLGVFSTKELARAAYLEAKKNHHPGFLGR